MFYLLLAILSSALVSVFMRLSTGKVSGTVSMLSINYLMCLGVAAGYTGLDNLFPNHAALPRTLGMGAISGVFYLLGFVLLQVNIKKNGVVLPAIFMKLGLLVPIVVSICFFHETPSLFQTLGFVIAILAIILINSETGQSVIQFRSGLILLLLGGGSADGMSKVFEELGDSSLSAQFLLYTFLAAFLLCTGLAFYKREHFGKYEAFFGLLVGIPNYFSARFLLYALKTVPAVITYPTFSVGTILIVTLTGVLFFKERLGKRQWLAIGIILIALVLLNL